jgi:hypothetical protein
MLSEQLTGYLGMRTEQLREHPQAKKYFED